MTEYIDRFWLRAIKVASEAAQRRFLKSFAAYVYAVIDEASDRNGGRVRSITDYLELRRLTSAVYSSTLFPAELGLDIPDEIMTHPAMESLLGLVADSALLTNVRIYRSWLCVDQSDLPELEPGSIFL